MTLRAWLAACSVAAGLAGCGGDPASSATVSTGDPRDASVDEPDASMSAADGGVPEPEQDASVISDAGRPAPMAPTTDGVHLSIERGPYRTARDAFYFETSRPGIQGEFEDGTLRVELSETLGATSCAEGATVEWQVAGGNLIANRELGACSITIEAFGDSSGASIAATFHATVERVSGEVADELELHGRVQVGHP